MMNSNSNRSSSWGHITLEEYHRFYQNRSLIKELTYPNLHQIIHMHGFYQLHGGTKDTLREAVKTLDLIPPTKSTLQGVTAVGPALSNDQIEEDIAAIGWADCALDSIRCSPVPPASVPAHWEEPVRPRPRRRLRGPPPKWKA